MLKQCEAQDIDTGENLSCEAKVVPIQRLEILTKQKTVLVGDYETLELLGYDEKGNVFSSLEGLKFDWKIKQKKNLAEFVDFKEASIKTTKIRHYLENSGYQTDIRVLRGLETGPIQVNTKLVDTIYGYLNTKSDLNIIEHFLIYPDHNLYVLPCEKINFVLYKIRAENGQLKYEKVLLPNNKYKWILSDSIAQIDQNGSLQIGKNWGNTELIVIDNQHDNNSIKTKINVTQPWSLKLFISEYDLTFEQQIKDNVFQYKKKLDISNFENNWVMMNQKEYVIKGVLFDEKENQIQLEKYSIKFKLDSEYFEIDLTKKDYIVFKTKKINDKIKIEAEVVIKNCQNIYQHDQKFAKIVSQIMLIKPNDDQIYLPYYQNSNNQQVFVINPLGGSKSYIFKSENPEIAQVNKNGIVQVIKPGKTKILCIDSLNNKNRDFINITITNVDKIAFQDKQKEGKIEDARDIYIKAFSPNNKIFANCTSINYNLKGNQLNIQKSEQSYQEFVKGIQNYFDKSAQDYEEFDIYSYLNESYYSYYLENNLISKQQLHEILLSYKNYGLCWKSFLITDQPGQYNLTLSSNINSELKPIESEYKVYDNFEIIYPDNYDKIIFGDIVRLTPGTSTLYKLKGGPKEWDGENEINYRVYSDKQTEKYFKSEIIKKNDEIYIKIYCKSDFDQTSNINGEFQILGSNKVTKKLLNPILISANLQVICGNPFKLNFYDKKDLEKGYENLQKPMNDQFLGNKSKRIIKFWPYDQNEKPFWNYTSIQPEWKLDNNKFGKIKKTDQNSEIELELNDKQGDFKLQVSSDSYSSSYKKFPKIENDLKLSSFDVLEVEPLYNILYLNPDNELKIHIKNGSGNFDFQFDEPSKVSYQYYPKKKYLLIKPLKEGPINLNITDKNSKQSKAELKIDIVKLDKIELEVEDPLVLVNNKTKARIHLYARNQLIPKDQQKFVNLKLTSSNPDLLIEQIEAGLHSYLITPKNKGSFIVNGEALNEGIFSNSVTIHGFSEIKTFPDKIVLAPSCTSQFKIIGGPSQNLRHQYGYIIKILNQNQFGQIKNLENDLYQYTANKKLDQNLKIQLISEKDKKVISETNLRIIVNTISDIFIVGLNELHQGARSRVSIVPQIQLNNISPVYCKFSYKISNSNPEILKSFSGQTSQDVYDKQIGVMAILSFDVEGLKSGSSTIEVEIIPQAIKGKDIKAQFEINVNDQIVLPSSGHLTQKPCNSSFFYMFPNSFYELEITNSHMNDMEVDVNHYDKVVQIQNDNVLRSFDKLGFDNLIIKKNGSLDNASMVVVALPKLMLVENSENLKYATNNNQYILQIKFLDSFGRYFINSNKDFKFKLLNSNPNIVSVFMHNQTQTISIQTKNNGKSTIYLQSLLYPNLFDVFQINIGPIITPEGKIIVHVGANINFKAIRKIQSKEWVSSDENILSIHSSGNSLAKNIGTAEIKLKNSLLPSSIIKIVKIDQLYQNQKNPSQITNIPSYQNYKEQYLFTFDLYSYSQKIELTENPSIQQNLRTICKVNDNDFIVNSYQGENNNQVGCYIQFVKNPINIQKEVLLTIELSSLQDQQYSLKQNITISVIPKFIVDKDQKSVFLNKESNEKSLYIKSTHKIQIKQPSKLQNYVKSVFNEVKKVTVIKIKIPKSYSESFKENLKLYSPLTDQQEIIQILYEPESSIWSYFNFLFSSNSSLSWLDIIAIAVCLLVLLIIFREFYKKDKKNEHQKDISASKYSSLSRSFHHNKSYIR